MAREIKEVNALTKIYDLLLWIIPQLEKFPKSQRYLLGDRIETMLLDIMELIIHAIYSKNKACFLKDANLKIEKLRYLIRLSKDLKYLSIKKYEYISKCDIRKYFERIDQEILLNKIENKIKCRDTLWLVRKIISSRESSQFIEYFEGDDLFTPIHRKKGEFKC